MNNISKKNEMEPKRNYQKIRNDRQFKKINLNHLKLIILNFINPYILYMII